MSSTSTDPGLAETETKSSSELQARPTLGLRRTPSIFHSDETNDAFCPLLHVWVGGPTVGSTFDYRSSGKCSASSAASSIIPGTVLGGGFVVGQG